MKLSVEELKARIWEDLGLNDRSIIFCYFDTEYGDGIGRGLIETEDDLYDNDEWWEFCYNEVPNIPTVMVEDCVTYMLGHGEVNHASGDECEYLNDAMHRFKRTFWHMLEAYADELCAFAAKEASNPAYDVLEEEDE